MKRGFLALLAANVVLLVAGVTSAIALTAGGSYDPGPYTACVNSKSGAIRMVDVLGGEPPWPACRSGEYSVSWANGFTIRDYNPYTSFSEHTTTTSWFHQLACPEGSEPLGGGGAFLPDDQADAAEMALQSSVPTLDEGLGGQLGWEVGLNSVDGQPHTGTFQVFVICAPATENTG